MLRDADNDAGFYAAACATDPDAVWKGAMLYVSSDGGATFSPAASIASETTMGYTTGALGDFHSGNIPDELNSVNVQLLQGSLSSTNLSGIMSGVNMAVIGNEILCFRDATLQADGSYTLRGLLRGRRGSEYAMGSHSAGERFVLADVSTLVRVPADLSSIGIERLYKAATLGSSLAKATPQPFTNEGEGLKPYAPVHLGGGRNADGDLTLTWVRRSRIDGSWRSNVDVPVSEASEAYDLEIYDGSGFANVVCTVYGITEPSVTYTAADQTRDGLTPGETVYFRVYQLSAAVGRGHAASGAV